MLFHTLYILAFTILAFLAVSSLIRNLINLGFDSHRIRAPFPYSGEAADSSTSANPNRPTPHPELLDDTGKMINEPLLVMRSIAVEDVREKLDALYDSSPSAENGSPNHNGEADETG